MTLLGILDDFKEEHQSNTITSMRLTLFGLETAVKLKHPKRYVVSNCCDSSVNYTFIGFFSASVSRNDWLAFIPFTIIHYSVNDVTSLNHIWRLNDVEC